jgi:hypothetical protein
MRLGADLRPFAGERTHVDIRMSLCIRVADARPNRRRGIRCGIVGLVPSAASAVVSAFATPILGDVAAPVTKFVLDKLQGK